VKTAIDKPAWFRGIDAPQMDVSGLPDERRRFPAQVARRSTNQGLERRKKRKYPILLAFVAQAAVDQLDEVVALFDQAVSARESRAKPRTEEALAERAKKGEARQLLMDVILPVLADPPVPDELVGGRLRDQIGMQRLRRSPPAPVLAHISPGHSDNVNFFGVINVDVEAELAKLGGGGGWRPLRAAQLDVPAEAAQVQMPGFGLELGGGASVGGQVLEGGVAELVERPALLVRAGRRRPA
jgi:hypothetical protein